MFCLCWESVKYVIACFYRDLYSFENTIFWQTCTILAQCRRAIFQLTTSKYTILSTQSFRTKCKQFVCIFVVYKTKVQMRTSVTVQHRNIPIRCVNSYAKSIPSVWPNHRSVSGNFSLHSFLITLNFINFMRDFAWEPIFLWFMLLLLIIIEIVMGTPL